MRCIKIRLPVLMVFALLSASASFAGSWTLSPDTTPAPSNADTVRLWTLVNKSDKVVTPPFLVQSAKATAIEVDASGSIYSAGYRDSGPGDELLVTRHGPDGTLLWEKIVTGTDRNTPVRMALDGNGHVYVAAIHYADGVSPSDVVLAELNATNGQVLCQSFYDHAGKGDAPVALLADANAAYVLVTVDQRIATTLSTDAAQDLRLLRFDSLACPSAIWSPAWQHGYPDVALGDIQQGDDEGTALVFDNPGNPAAIFVLGTTQMGSSRHGDVVTLKYDLAGNRLWKQLLAGNHRDKAVAMDVAGGAPYVTFSRQAAQGLTLSTWIAGLNTVDGSPSSGWPVEFISDTSSANAVDDVPKAIRAMAGDGVYVAVKSSVGTPSDVMAVKYDLSGNELWRSLRYDVGDDDEPVAIDVNIADEVYVAATQGNAIQGGHDMVMLHYELGGILQDTFVIPSSADEHAGAIALGLDGGTQLTVHMVGGGADLSVSDGGSFSIVKFGHALPDLTTAVTAYPASAVSDGAITIQSSVLNIQDATLGKLLSIATPFAVNFYLTPTSPATTRIPFAGSSARQLTTGLASGATDNASVSLTIPSATVLTPGNYYLLAEVDQSNVIPERIETNNVWISPTTVSVVDPPNLIATSISGPLSVTAGRPVSLSYAISNTRPANPPASAYASSFFLVPLPLGGGATDIPIPVTTPGSALVSAGVVPTVIPPVSVTIPANTPAAVPGGTPYLLRIVVDSGNAIAEAIESDNTLLSTQTINVLPIPDLMVAFTGYDAGATTGKSLSLSDSVTTAAGGSSSAFDVSYYLSTDALISATSDIFIGRRTITAPVTATSPNGATTPVTIPAGVTPGSYFLGAIVDSAAQVAESDETNNHASSVTQISVGLPAGSPGAVPDLWMKSVSAPVSVGRVTPFNVTTVVSNLLEPAASAFTLGVYLSVDAVITNSDYVLAMIPNSGLAGNSTVSATTSVSIPADQVQTATWNAAGSGFCGTVLAGGSELQSLAACGKWPRSGSGALSNEVMTADGKVEVTVPPRQGSNIAMGLSRTRTAPHGYRDAEYMFTVNTGGILSVYEKCAELNGCRKWPAAGIAFSNPGDRLIIERIGSVIKYYKNSALLYTSTVPSSGAIHADVSLNDSGGFVTLADGHQGSRINNVTLTNSLVPAGSYFIGAIADTGAAVAELTESNNAAVNSHSPGINTGTVIAIQSVPSAATDMPASSGGGGVLMLLLIPLWFRFRMHCVQKCLTRVI